MNKRDTIERTLELAHTPERVWRAITEPDEVSRWFPERSTVAAHAGAEGLLIWPEQSHRTRVVTFDPPRHYAYEWQHLPAKDGDGSFESIPHTRVDFRLEAITGGTRLFLVESGFAAFPDELHESGFADHESGWTQMLGRLADYVAAAPVPQPA